MLNNEPLYPGCLLKALVDIVALPVYGEGWLIIHRGALLLVLDVKAINTNKAHSHWTFRLLTSNGTLVGWGADETYISNEVERVLP